MTYHYDFVPTPFGDALTVHSATGLVCFDLSEEDPSVPWLLDRFARALGDAPRPGPGTADELAHQIDAYFAGEEIDLAAAVRLDWRLTSGFAGDALRAISEIGYGETMSYGDVAVLAGRPRAARAVGTACRLSPFSIVLPVHRVLRADGMVGQYGSHPERKRYLLDLEHRVKNR